MTTIATSVTVVDGPLVDAAALDARVAELRRRFPRAIIDRYLAMLPVAGERTLIFPGAAVVGDVRLGDDVSIWYGAVLRGDLMPVTVGARTNIQDGTVVHVADDGACDIGAGSVVGAGALVTARTVIPPRSLVLGAPGKVVRTLTADDEAFHRALAAKYVRLKENYRRDALR